MGRAGVSPQSRGDQAVMELINLVVALAVIGVATYFVTGRAPAWVPRAVAVLLAAQAAVFVVLGRYGWATVNAATCPFWCLLWNRPTGNRGLRHTGGRRLDLERRLTVGED